MNTVTLSNIGDDTAHLLEQFMAELASEAGDLDERRTETRHQFQAPLTLGVALGGASAGADAYRPLYRGWGTELSRNGMGLLLEHTLDPGLQLWVNLESAFRRRCLLPVRVIYCKQLLPHTFRIGAVFTFEPAGQP